MITLTLIFIALLCISLAKGRSSSFGYSFSFYINKLAKLRYNFGLSHKEYKGHIEASSEQVTIEVITIGLIFFDLEFEFYKKLEDGISRED